MKFKINSHSSIRITGRATLIVGAGLGRVEVDHSSSADRFSIDTEFSIGQIGRGNPAGIYGFLPEFQRYCRLMANDQDADSQRSEIGKFLDDFVLWNRRYAVRQNQPVKVMRTG
jgi:hypothetical protein